MGRTSNRHRGGEASAAGRSQQRSRARRRRTTRTTFVAAAAPLALLAAAGYWAYPHLRGPARDTAGAEAPTPTPTHPAAPPARDAANATHRRPHPAAGEPAAPGRATRTRETGEAMQPERGAARPATPISRPDLGLDPWRRGGPSVHRGVAGDGVADADPSAADRGERRAASGDAGATPPIPALSRAALGLAFRPDDTASALWLLRPPATGDQHAAGEMANQPATFFGMELAAPGTKAADQGPRIRDRGAEP